MRVSSGTAYLGAFGAALMSSEASVLTGAGGFTCMSYMHDFLAGNLSSSLVARRSIPHCTGPSLQGCSWCGGRYTVSLIPHSVY